jgi:hypothetical protein
MKKLVVVALAVAVTTAAAALARAVIPSGPSGSWQWSEATPGRAASVPGLVLAAANRSGVEPSSIRELVTGLSGHGSLAVLAGRDRAGHMCLSYTRDGGVVASTFRCLVGDQASKAIVLFASGGGATPDSLDWLAVAGVVRSDVTSVVLEFPDGSRHDLALNTWRAFSYYAGSAAAKPIKLLAYRANGTKVADVDLAAEAGSLGG